MNSLQLVFTKVIIQRIDLSRAQKGGDAVKARLALWLSNIRSNVVILSL